jgi:hypothetical protein
MKKKVMHRQTRREGSTHRHRRSAASSRTIATNRRLSELTEAQEIMLPELSARIAAVEHLLVEMQICSHDDLIKSREFVDMRREGP